MNMLMIVLAAAAVLLFAVAKAIEKHGTLLVPERRADVRLVAVGTSCVLLVVFSAIAAVDRDMRWWERVTLPALGSRTGTLAVGLLLQLFVMGVDTFLARTLRPIARHAKHASSSGRRTIPFQSLVAPLDELRR